MLFSRYILIGLFALHGCLHAQSTDFASSRLLAIAEKEALIYKKIAEDPEFYSEDDLERRMGDLIEAYTHYLTDQPDDVSAYILYGKLLRRTGQNEAAFKAFLKADELDPNIAVVKQQIGTHLADEGNGKAALPFYLLAVELEPETATYHFALGELLLAFRDTYIKESIFTQDALEREMLKAFRKAAALEPDNFEFQMRLGEAFYDLNSPDWKSALVHWNKLSKKTTTRIQGEVLALHRARVLGKLGRGEDAQALLEQVLSPALQKSKQQVIDEIAQH